jgi:ribosomal protein S18 acetylase RimI-like enzyme
MLKASRYLTRKSRMNWVFDQAAVDWNELSQLYRIAPLGEKKPADLQTVFSNSRYKCFVYSGDKLIGAGRALADGVDCSYLCDIAVHPDHQGSGLGKAIIARLRECSAGHRKIILYAKPGKEGFYRKLGFLRMRTAMAVFSDQERAIAGGLLEQLPADPTTL